SRIRGVPTCANIKRGKSSRRDGMGFIDKVRASVKSGAEAAATKAQEEYGRMQVRRELADAYEILGTKAFDLADRGELSHAELAPLVEQVRAAKAKLETIGKEDEAAPAPAPAPEPAPPASAEQPEPAAEEPPPTT